jgi:hypothetical protein
MCSIYVVSDLNKDLSPYDCNISVYYSWNKALRNLLKKINPDLEPDVLPETEEEFIELIGEYVQHVNPKGSDPYFYSGYFISFLKEQSVKVIYNGDLIGCKIEKIKIE